ncbi:uncharacterized protein EAF02_000575 [Botrytis sinoallii]|uniref:uncharacterized protein n=1 Tax=Botrytis sinoallii TaxID=1463999 RepID=UPI00190003FD|nr:uncharacterized protein EAF02_000575 [Botrytis sinoallii]KAF7893037.1 hypothetical protein EAF02_000575 [Botrytis sinoallii]
MAEKRDRYGTGGDPSIAQRGNGYGSGNGNGARGYNGRAPPNLGFDGEGSSVSGRGPNDRRYGSMPPNTPMTPYTPYTPYTPVTAGYDGGESFISAETPRHDHYYGGESAIGGRPAVTPGAAGYRGGESSYNGGTPQTGRFNGGESYAEGRAPRPGRYDIAESTMSVDTPRTARFDPGMESSIAHPDTPRTAHYDTTATTMSMDPSRTGPYDKENTITVAEYYDPERARENERQMMEREKSERERGMRQPSGMEYGPRPTEYLSTSGSSTSSYLDISRHFPTKGFSFRSFFSTPSEKSDSKKKKEKKKKKSKKLTKHNTSSSSSLNEDLAYGTGFLRYRRKRSVRARDGRDRQWETIGYKSSKENLRDTRSPTNDRPASSKRPATDAELLALGAGIAGLAKLALDHTNKDAKNGKNGRGVPEPVTSSRRDERGLPPSKAIPYETDPNDDEAWESASEDESDSSVDTGLAFGGGSHVGKKSQAGLFGRKKTHGPKSRKSNVVDPRLLGPENSLNGYLSDRAVGFEDVQWESGSDFGQHTYIPYSHPDRQVDTLYVHERVRISRTQSVGSGSQTPLQEVFPVPTNDPSRFDVARASSSEYNASRPAPVPIQQPQPITPVSHSVYHESNYVRSESGGILKSSSGRSKSLAGAALAGVAGAAVGAAIASGRRDENESYRDDDRRENRSYSESAVNRRESDRKERRYEEDQYSIADSSVSKPRDEDRKERRRDYDQSSIADSNLTWDEKREKRREERRKDDSRSSTSNSDRDKNRERSRDDPDAAAEERERRRRERREERRAPDRIEDNYEERRAHVLSEISAMARTPTDPFQYQVANTPPREESSSRQAKDQSAPAVVTVEREPDFNRKQNSSIKESSSISRSESRTEISIKVEKEQRYKEHARTLHDAEMIYEETEHSTAPIEAAAIAAAAAALARESRRESRSSKRRGERRTDFEDLSKGGDSAEAPGQSHDEVMAEADRAYREILMARKVAAEVRRSRTPSPERSVMNKYEEEPEEEPPRIVTPPGMHERKKGPYDAPNADFKLDYIMTPRDLKVYSIPSRRYKVDESDLKGPFMTKDADAKLPRPMLNLIRPTPTSTPSPEKQFATMAKNGNVKKDSSNQSDDRSVESRRSEPEPEPERNSKTKDRDGEREQPSIRSQDEPAQPQPKDQVEDREQTPLYRSQDKPSDTVQIREQIREQTTSYRSKEESHDQDRPKRDRRDIPPIIIGPRGDLIRSSDVSVPSPTQSTVSKAVTWGPNETKHFEVESPTEPRDEYISDSSPETPEKPRFSEPRFSEPRFSEPKLESPTEPKSPSGWAAMAAGIIGAGVGAAVAGSSESPNRPERPESPKKPERAEVSELARILKARESERPESPKRAEISELARILKEREKERPESPKKPERAEVSELARILKARESERPESPKRAEISELARILKERESERPESPKRAEVSELARILKAREQERNERPYEYRGVTVEPESPFGEPRRDSPPRDMRRDSLYRGVTVEPESPYGETFRDVDRDSLYRGVTVEPESPHGEMRSESPPRENRRESSSQHTRRDSPPSVGPKPVSPRTSHMPGAFDDDLDFTATVAAGLQDSGFDPNIVVDDLAFRKRDSPPGSNEYKTPWAESIDDLSSIPGESSSNRGFVMGEVLETPKDWSSVSPANEESPSLTRKEQKRLEKERRRSGGDVASPITDVIVEEPESYFDPSRQSKKESRRRDKEEVRTQSLLREESSFVDILPNREIVEEPESYVEPVETPKKPKKSSRSSTYEDIDLDSKPKRKSSKRSSTYDGKVESPLRESRRTFSMDDIKSGDESRIPRKSKRDSVRFDSPPPEVDSESGRSLRRKSKEKLGSKSERYDSPDPSQISLPASDNYEDMELSREPDRPSRRDGDDPLWASSRSILSAGSSSKVDEEDSPQKNRKDRSTTKENNDATRPIASEPTRDDNEDSKKKTKEATPKKSGGLFGFFSGAKAEAAKEELRKGSRDDPDDVKKKKKKRSSTSDGITEGQSFSDSQLVSSETNGHKTRGEDGVQDSRNDGERKRSKSSDSKKGSFLDNAGILGAGAGLAAGAIAISAQHQQQHAANNNDSEGSTGDMGKLEREEDILDPEIIERQIRPSIDPQYGDLLPLPPSGSVSPNCEPIDDLPKLPESRPTTPESEKRTVSTPREKTPRNRKSLQETPVKSPSQSAVPLKFVMGNRSNLASPIITRSTGNTPFPTFHPSPIAESATIPRSRSRPMSWDNTKEFKPLYLLETNRRGSFVPEELIDPLPHLPPSRTNSELDVAGLPESGFLEKLDLHRPSLDPLSTNLPSDDHTSGESTPTAIAFKRDLAPSVEFLQDSFPSLEEKQTLSSGAFHEQSSSETVAKAIGAAGIATAAGLAVASHGTSDEQEPRSSQDIQEKSGNDNLEYSSESHDMPSEREETLQNLSGASSNQTMSIEEEVEQTEEFPLSNFKKNEGKGLTLESDDIHDQAENTPEPIQELSNPVEGDNVESVDNFSTPESKNNQGKNGTAALSQEPGLELQSESPSQEDTQGPKSDYASSEPDDVTGPDRDLIEQAATSEAQLIEYPTQNSEEEKVHEKADNNVLSFEPELKTRHVDSVEPLKPMDETLPIDKSVDEPQQQVQESGQMEEALPSVEIDQIEELSVPKSKKDKKKAKADALRLEGLTTEPIVESVIEVPTREPSLEVSPELSREISQPSSPLASPEAQAFNGSALPENSGDITPTVSESASPKSKRDKKKSKKSKPIPLDPQSEQAVVQPELNEAELSQSEDVTRNHLDLSQELVQEPIQAEPTTPVNVEPIEEFSTPKSKKSKKDKRKAKKEQIANVEQDPIDVTQEQEQVPEVQEKELPEAFTLEDTPNLDDTTHAIASPSLKKNRKKSKKGKTAEIEGPVEPTISGPIPEDVSEKPTPMVGPGGWPITPATPWTAGAQEIFSSNEKDYFPAAETILPIITAGDTVIGAEQLKSNDIFEDKNGSDSLAAGHEDNQLGLENQSQEESKPQEIVIEDVSKDIGEDVTEFNGLPAGSQEDESSLPRQLPAEIEDNIEENHPPQEERDQISAIEIQEEEKPISNETEAPGGFEAGYKDDQQALFKDLKEELEFGSGKHERDDKSEEHANQDQIEEVPSDISSSDNAIKGLDEPTNVPTPQAEIIEDPAIKAILEEPEEIAQADKKPQMPEDSVPVENVIKEQTPLEETSTMVQESESIENTHIDQDFPEPATTEMTPIDPIISAPEPEVETQSKESKEQENLDSLLASNPSEDMKTPGTSEENTPVDASSEHLEPEHLQGPDEASIAIDSTPESATSDKSQDNMIEPTPIEEVSVSENVDQANIEEDKAQGEESADVKQEIPDTPLKPPTVDREIEFSAPPKKSEKDKNKRDKQVQDSIEEDAVAKDIKPTGESSNIEMPIEQPNTMPVEQIITIPAKEQTSNDAPMTAGLSGLMGPLTGRKKGVLEMVQALGWGKKKDKAAIAAAEQGLPPRPSTARAASESFMSTPRVVSESAMPKVIETEPVKAPSPTTELEEWALADENSKTNSKKGKKIASEISKIAQNIMEPSVTQSTEDVQDDQSPKRQKGKKRLSLQSFISEEASKAFRARESANQGPETPALKAEPAFIEQSHEFTSEPIIDTPVEEAKNTESMIEVPNMKLKEDKKKRRSSQSPVSEEMSKEEADVSRDAVIEKEPELQAPEIHEPSAESSSEPSEFQREPTLEESQAPEVSNEDAPEPVVETPREPEELDRGAIQEDLFTSPPRPEHIPEPIVENHSKSSEPPHSIDQGNIFVPEPLSEDTPEQATLERSNESSDVPREVIQDDDNSPQASFDLVTEPSAIDNEASPPNKSTLEKPPKNVDISEPSLVDELFLPNESIQDDIMASVVYVEPDASLQESRLSVEPLSEELDNAIEVKKPDTVDELTSPSHIVFEEDSREVEVAEPSHDNDQSFLPQEPLLEETHKGVDGSLTKQVIPREESGTLETFEPSHTDEETLLSTEPATKIETVQAPCEIDPAEETEVQDESTLPITKKSKENKKNKKSRNKSQSEPEVPIEVAKEPEQTLLVEEQILEKPFVTTESSDREALEQPLERSVETIEPESRDVLEPASVPLPEDDINESIELDEPTSFENLQPSLNLSPSIQIPEETIIKPEIEVPKSLEDLDDSEHAASIPLPEDIVMNPTEDIEHQGHELAEALEPVPDAVEKTIETPSDIEIPASKGTLEFPEPISPILEKSSQEPAPVSPKRSRKDEKKRKSATPVLLAEESLSSDPLLESETKAVEPTTEEARIVVSEPPVDRSSEEVMFSKPQEAEFLSELIDPETEQKGIEPIEDITTPSISDEIEHILQEKHVEPPAEVPTEESEKEREEQKSEVPILDSEDITSQAPLEPLPIQPDGDVSNQETVPNSTKSIPESVQTANENISSPNLIDVEVKQDDTPKSVLDIPLEQHDLESGSKDITDFSETNSPDAPVIELKEDEKDRKSLHTSPSFELPMESTSEMTEISQPINQASEEELHGIEPAETVREIVQQPTELQEHALEQEHTEEDPKVFMEPVIESIASEPSTNISHGPTVESENFKEDDLTPQEPIVQQESSSEPKSLEEPSLVLHQIIEPETVNEETFLPQNAMINSIVDDEEAPQSQELEPETKNGESFLPQESTVESSISSEEPTFQQELETVREISNFESSLVQNSVVEPIPEEEQIVVEKPVIELNIPEPAQIALPESPIEQTSFEQELSFPQESLTEPEVVEEAPIIQDRATGPQSSDIKLLIPQESPLEQNVVEPAQISLPESPIEQEVSEPEVSSQQELVSENHIVEEPSLSREQHVEPKSSHPELVNYSEWPFGRKTVEPEQIALPESPIEQESFEPEVLFRQEPVVESQYRPVPSDSSELLFEENAGEKELSFPQDTVDPEITDKAPNPHEQDIDSKFSEQESTVSQELPIEQSIRQPLEINGEEPVSESNPMDDMTIPQESSVEPTKLESDMSSLTIVPEESARDLEPGFLNESGKDKEEREENLDISETSGDPSNVTLTSQVPENQALEIVSESTPFDPVIEPVSSSPDVVSENLEPIANVEQINPDLVEPTSNTEPIANEQVIDSALEDPVHGQRPTESLAAETGSIQRDEWAQPIEESKEVEKEVDDVLQPMKEQPDVAPQASEITNTPFEITDKSSMGDDAKELANGDITETDDESFLDAVESFPIEDTPMNLTPRASREPVEAIEPEFEELTQEPAEQSIPEVIKPLHEEEFVPAPMPETVRQNDDAFPNSEDVTLDEHKSIPVDELSKNDLSREMLNGEHPKEEHRPADDDVTEVLTKNSKDINDREFGFSSPVQFIPKDTQIGVPDVVEPVPTEITLDEFKAIPTGEMPKEAQQQTEDEWGSSSTKKSRKDKEILKSTLSTPLEPEVPNVATELPEDIPPNSGKLEELLPTIEDVPDTHTSFQIPQVDKIVSEHDPFDMSHDKNDKMGKGISSRELDPEPEIPALANTVAVSDLQDVKPGERLLTSPIPIRNIVPASNPIAEPDMTSPPSSSSFKPLIDESKNLSTALVQVPSKKDKRKRQATINLETPKDDQRTFWADEVPEAEVTRAVPVIEDIGRDEFYSHIASTVKESDANEFSRPPAKKGKKNTRRESTDIKDFQSSMGEDLSKIEPMKERKEMPSVVAATAAIVSAATLASKSKESEVGAVEEDESPMMEILSEEEEHGLSMDKIAPSDDVSDDSVPREDMDSKVSDEVKDESVEKNDEYDSDGFREINTTVQEPEQIENFQDPMIETSDKAAAVEPQEFRTPRSLSPVLDITRFTQEPEQMDSMQQKEVAETSESNKVERSILHEPEETNTIQEPTEQISTEHAGDENTIFHQPKQMEPVQKPTTQVPAEPTIVERQILQESEQIGAPQEQMVQIPAKPSIMEDRESTTPTPPRNFDPNDDKPQETALAAQTYASSSSSSPRRSPPAREPRGDLPEEYLSRPSRRDIEKKRRKKSIEVDDSLDLLPAPIQEALRNTIVEPRARETSPSPISSPIAERAKRARSRSRPPSRPGTPGLTMLREESEDENALNVGNRDSAFIGDSPNPPQGNFADKHEDIRDSGIHLRDNSPSMRVRAPVSSTDAAIDSMTWPSVDEDAGTVNLEQPQRPKVVEDLTRHGHGIDDLPSQRHKEEGHTDLHRTQAIHRAHSPHEEKHKLSRKTSLSRGELAEANHVDFVRSQRLKAFQTKSKEKLSEPPRAEAINKPVTPEKEHRRHRVHRSEFPDVQYRKPKENKYGDLEPVKTPKTSKTEQRSVSESSPSLIGSAALAAAGSGFAAARKLSQESRPLSAQSHKSQRSASNISVTRLRTPVPLDAPQAPQFPDSAKTNRSFTPPLRRSARKISGDPRSLRQQSNIDLAKEIDPASINTATSTTSTNTANPTANEGRARAQDMADVYDGYGEGHMGSPRSPTRPHSMRRRQSMQVLELESKLDQLTAENRALAESKAHAEHMLRSSQGAPAALVERDAQIDLLKRTLSSMQDEVKRLTEVNAGLSSAAVTLGQQHNARYGTLESQHAQTSRELQQAREAHHNLQSEVQGIIHNAIQERDQEIASLRSQLDVAKEQIRAMQREILAAKAGDAQFLIIRDEDYFDNACQQLCQHVQQWVLRFSKFSDMRACRLTSEINNDKTIDRLDNAILDGSDVDSYLADRVRRRDVFMSMTMTMVWEFIFTRYLFGMDREQRQKLKSLEKVLSEVGPPSAVHQWRATTLTLLSKRDSFARQKEQDTLAVVHAVLETLTEILPPPSHLENQIEEQLKRVIKAAVDLSIEMRTQRAEYMMLPPLQPEYDANGDLASKVSFNAALMNERSGDTISNEELEAQRAVVRVVLFPLVVKKGDDLGQGDEEIVVCPAQVLVAKPRMGKGPVGRVYSPASGADMDRRSDRSRTPASLQSSMPDANVI